MRIVQSILFFLVALLLSEIGIGQVSLLSLQSNTHNYKQALKASKASGSPVLVILYAPDQPVRATNKMIEANRIVEEANVIPVVIDWVKSPNRKPQKYLRAIQNPTWLLIHHDEAIISVADSLFEDRQLVTFLNKGLSLHSKMDKAYQQKENSKEAEKLFALAKICQEIPDKRYTSKVLDDYLKRRDPSKLTNKRLHDIIKMGVATPGSKRLDKLIKQERERAIAVSSEDTVLYLQRYFILDDLKKKDLLEPYFVWEKFEKEFGYQADSLYRIFAISYFSSTPASKDMLYNEAFDYINIYPRSPWPYLQQLYKIIVPATTDKKDLDILLDLISFQLFREESHVKLDYKALILYKLGHKERALSMISDVNTMALNKGLKYKSMLYSLK